LFWQAAVKLTRTSELIERIQVHFIAENDGSWFVSEQSSEIKERFSEIELELVLHDAQVVAAGDRLQPRRAKGGTFGPPTTSGSSCCRAVSD